MARFSVLTALFAFIVVQDITASPNYLVLKDFPAPLTGFIPADAVGTWYYLVGKASCTLQAETEYSDYHIFLMDSPNSKVTIEFYMRYRGECGTLKLNTEMTSGNPAEMKYRDTIGLLSGKMVVIDTDYTQYLVIWGCDRLGIDNNCEDPWLAAFVRNPTPSVHLLKTINDVFSTRWNLGLKDLDSPKRNENPCPMPSTNGDSNILTSFWKINNDNNVMRNTNNINSQQRGNTRFSQNSNLESQTFMLQNGNRLAVPPYNVNGRRPNGPLSNGNIFGSNRASANDFKVIGPPYNNVNAPRIHNINGEPSNNMNLNVNDLVLSSNGNNNGGFGSEISPNGNNNGNNNGGFGMDMPPNGNNNGGFGMNMPPNGNNNGNNNGGFGMNMPPNGNNNGNNNGGFGMDMPPNGNINSGFGMDMPPNGNNNGNNNGGFGMDMPPNGNNNGGFGMDMPPNGNNNGGFDMNMPPNGNINGGFGMDMSPNGNNNGNNNGGFGMNMPPNGNNDGIGSSNIGNEIIAGSGPNAGISNNNSGSNSGSGDIAIDEAGVNDGNAVQNVNNADGSSSSNNNRFNTPSNIPTPFFGFGRK